MEKIKIRTKKELSRIGTVLNVKLTSCYVRYVDINNYIGSNENEYSVATDSNGNKYIVNKVQRCVNGCCYIEQDSDGVTKFWKKLSEVKK